MIPNNSIPIHVVCSFTEEGKPKPLKIGFTDDNGENIRLDINGITDISKLLKISKPVPVYYYAFKFYTIINDCRRHFELYFDCETCKWFLKMK